MLVASPQFNCSNEILSITAMLSGRPRSALVPPTVCFLLCFACTYLKFLVAGSVTRWAHLKRPITWAKRIDFLAALDASLCARRVVFRGRISGPSLELRVGKDTLIASFEQNCICGPLLRLPVRSPVFVIVFRIVMRPVFPHPQALLLPLLRPACRSSPPFRIRGSPCLISWLTCVPAVSPQPLCPLFRSGAPTSSSPQLFPATERGPKGGG